MWPYIYNYRHTSTIINTFLYTCCRMFDNDKLQKNMMDIEYTQNRKELLLPAELISAC